MGPSVLLLDDGDLSRFTRLLKEIGADFVRLEKHEITGSLPRPRDLLITNGSRALDMPSLAGDADEPEPVWICMHNQDFLPLRQRLRDTGVHFLIHHALDLESLRLLLVQLLYRGRERRRSRRLPIRCDATVREASDVRIVKVVELSREACRIATERRLAPGREVGIALPQTLGGGRPLELAATVRSCTESGSAPAGRSFSVVLDLGPLAPAAREQLDAVMDGLQIGTRVSALSEPPLRPSCDASGTSRADGVDVEAADDPGGVEAPEDPRRGGAPDDRRAHERFSYGRRVLALGVPDEDEIVALGHDLSTAGIRLSGSFDLEPGTRLTLAMHGGVREEPVLAPAVVARNDGPDGLALRFEDLPPDRAAQIERLASGRPVIESLREEISRGRVVVSRVRPLRPGSPP